MAEQVERGGRVCACSARPSDVSEFPSSVAGSTCGAPSVWGTGARALDVRKAQGLPALAVGLGVEVGLRDLRKARRVRGVERGRGVVLREVVGELPVLPVGQKCPCPR